MDDFEKWFENTCKDVFKFLMDDYGFQYSGMQKFGYILISCSFKSKDVEISASYDYREGYINVGMSPLNNEEIDGISKENKVKLIRLISDLQNPDLSIIKKINFIKLNWGKNLFGSEFVS